MILYNFQIKKITQFISFLLFTTFFMTSCSQKFYNIAYTDEELHGIQIEGKITEIEVTDRRLPQLPVLNKKLSEKEERKQILLLDNENIVFPDFTKDRKQMLEWKIRSYFTNTGRNIKVKCDILRTVKKQTKHIFKRDEIFSMVELSIAIFNEDKKLLDFNSAASYYNLKVPSSIPSDLDLIFEKTIRNAVYRSFDEMKTIKKTITVGQHYRYSLIKKED
jgi:hypothetical protein